MIDLINTTFSKQRTVPTAVYSGLVAPILDDGEEIAATFSGIRDGVIFTSKRIILVQNKVGTEKEFSCIPYSRVQAYAIKAQGVIGTDSELEVAFSGLGRLALSFAPGTNVAPICKLLSQNVL